MRRATCAIELVRRSRCPAPARRDRSCARGTRRPPSAALAGAPSSASDTCSARWRRFGRPVGVSKYDSSRTVSSARCSRVRSCSVTITTPSPAPLGASTSSASWCTQTTLPSALADPVVEAEATVAGRAGDERLARASPARPGRAARRSPRSGAAAPVSRPSSSPSIGETCSVWPSTASSQCPTRAMLCASSSFERLERSSSCSARSRSRNRTRSTSSRGFMPFCAKSLAPAANASLMAGRSLRPVSIRIGTQPVWPAARGSGGRPRCPSGSASSRRAPRRRASPRGIAARPPAPSAAVCTRKPAPASAASAEQQVRRIVVGDQDA